MLFHDTKATFEALFPFQVTWKDPPTTPFLLGSPRLNSSDPATKIVLCGLSTSSVTAGQEQAHSQLCHTRTLIKRCFKSWPCHCRAACCAFHSLCSSTSSLKEQAPSETITLLNCGFGEGKKNKTPSKPQNKQHPPCPRKKSQSCCSSSGGNGQLCAKQILMKDLQKLRTVTHTTTGAH